MQFSYGVSSTGVVHKILGPTAAICSSSNRGLKTRLISEAALADKPDACFCAKCFSAASIAALRTNNR